MQLVLAAAAICIIGGIVYAVGFALAAVGMMLGVAVLAIFVVGLILYTIKEVWQMLFKRKPVK